MRTHLLALLAFGLTTGGSMRAAQQAGTYRPVATIKDIMNTMVGPSADHIW